MEALKILSLVFFFICCLCAALAIVDEQAVSMHLRRLTDWIQLRAVAACDSLKPHFCKGWKGYCFCIFCNKNDWISYTWYFVLCSVRSFILMLLFMVTCILVIRPQKDAVLGAYCICDMLTFPSFISNASQPYWESTIDCTWCTLSIQHMTGIAACNRSHLFNDLCKFPSNNTTFLIM